MSEALHQYLENTWLLIEAHIVEPEMCILKKLFQQRKNKIDILDCAFKKITSLENLPVTSEDCAKLMLGILLAETLQANKIISPEKQAYVFNVMLTTLNENEHLIQPIAKQLAIKNNAISSPTKALAFIKLTLSLAAGAAALWLTGPYCALAARYLFSAGYLALHGEPNWYIRYSYFIPAQEWIGNLAFAYGPKLLALPSSIMSAKAIDTAMHALSHTQKMLIYTYRHTLTQHKNMLKAIPEPIYTGLSCYL